MAKRDGDAALRGPIPIQGERSGYAPVLEFRLLVDQNRVRTQLRGHTENRSGEGEAATDFQADAVFHIASVHTKGGLEARRQPGAVCHLHCPRPFHPETQTRHVGSQPLQSFHRFRADAQEQAVDLQRQRRAARIVKRRQLAPRPRCRHRHVDVGPNRPSPVRHRQLAPSMARHGPHREPFRCLVADVWMEAHQRRFDLVLPPVLPPRAGARAARHREPGDVTPLRPVGAERRRRHVAVDFRIVRLPAERRICTPSPQRDGPTVIGDLCQRECASGQHVPTGGTARLPSELVARVRECLIRPEQQVPRPERGNRIHRKLPAARRNSVPGQRSLEALGARRAHPIPYRVNHMLRDGAPEASQPRRRHTLVGRRTHCEQTEPVRHTAGQTLG